MSDIYQKFKDHLVSEKTQKALNTPLKNDSGFNEVHEEFLKMLIKKLQNGEIDPHNAKTLYNKTVYDALSEEDKEKADLTAMNLMSIIRQIDTLSKENNGTTFQMQNLVETVFQMKSVFENAHGNIYVI